MTKKFQIYKCAICRNIVEVLHEGHGQLVCCDQAMNLLEEKTEEVGKEKHVPMYEKINNGIRVKVGGIPHPMEEKHYVEWIEVITNNSIARKFLNPGETPDADFDIGGDVLQVRAYCNIHNLWSKK